MPATTATWRACTRPVSCSRDVMGVKPEEVFVGGNSSLQLMYNLISMGYCVRLPGVSLPLVSGGEAQVPLPGARL